MRCEKMHATISVAQCLKNQRKLAGVDGSPHVKSLRYPGCQDCATGARARAGELHDDDWRALLAGYRDRRHPPEDVVTVAEQREQSKEESMEEAKKKQCIKCGETKPLDRFKKDKKAKDGRGGLCIECNRIYHQHWRDNKVKALVKAELVRQEARLIEDHAEAARQSMEEQMEPAPAKEITAPTCPQNEDQILELILDFSCYPEVLKEIKRIAHHEERPPEVQARFMLKRLLKPWPRETAALRERAERFNPEYFHHNHNTPYQPMCLGMDGTRGRDEADVAGGANG